MARLISVRSPIGYGQEGGAHSKIFVVKGAVLES